MNISRAWERQNLGPYHSSHGSRGVFGVKVGGSSYSLLLDDVGGACLIRHRGGHHVIGWVGGVATAPGGRWGVGSDFGRVQRRRPGGQGHACGKGVQDVQATSKQIVLAVKQENPRGKYSPGASPAAAEPLRAGWGNSGEGNPGTAAWDIVDMRGAPFGMNSVAAGLGACAKRGKQVIHHHHETTAMLDHQHSDQFHRRFYAK